MTETTVPMSFIEERAEAEDRTYAEVIQEVMRVAALAAEDDEWAPGWAHDLPPCFEHQSAYWQREIDLRLAQPKPTDREENEQ